jgi:hypothetical protein
MELIKRIRLALILFKDGKINKWKTLKATQALLKFGWHASKFEKIKKIISSVAETAI